MGRNKMSAEELLMESYYSFIKRTEPNSPTLTIMERLREMLINEASIYITLDETVYKLPLREAWKVADELGVTLDELRNIK
jgi:hypothetical protein